MLASFAVVAKSGIQLGGEFEYQLAKKVPLSLSGSLWLSLGVVGALRPRFLART